MNHEQSRLAAFCLVLLHHVLVFSCTFNLHHVFSRFVEILFVSCIGGRENCAPPIRLRFAGALRVHGSQVDTHDSPPGVELRGPVEPAASLQSFPWLCSLAPELTPLPLCPFRYPRRCHARRCVCIDSLLPGQGQRLLLNPTPTACVPGTDWQVVCAN